MALNKAPQQQQQGLQQEKQRVERNAGFLNFPGPKPEVTSPAGPKTGSDVIGRARNRKGRHPPGTCILSLPVEPEGTSLEAEPAPIHRPYFTHTCAAVRGESSLGGQPQQRPSSSPAPGKGGPTLRRPIPAAPGKENARNPSRAPSTSLECLSSGRTGKALEVE